MPFLPPLIRADEMWQHVLILVDGSVDCACFGVTATWIQVHLVLLEAIRHEFKAIVDCNLWRQFDLKEKKKKID